MDQVSPYRKHTKHNNLWEVAWHHEPIMFCSFTNITVMLKLGVQKQKQINLHPALPKTPSGCNKRETFNINKHRRQDNAAVTHVAQKHIKKEQEVEKTLDRIYTTLVC